MQSHTAHIHHRNVCGFLECLRQTVDCLLKGSKGRCSTPGIDYLAFKRLNFGLISSTTIIINKPKMFDRECVLIVSFPMINAAVTSFCFVLCYFLKMISVNYDCSLVIIWRTTMIILLATPTNQRAQHAVGVGREIELLTFN